MNESITIGHPSEFFREVKKIFTTSVDPNMKMVTEDKKLELAKTPIEGVAKFDEELRGRCNHHVVKTGNQIFGVGAICAAAAGIVVLLVFLNLSTLMYYLFLGVFIILFISGGLSLSLANKHYVADLYLTLEGEAYQAKTVEPQGERVSVFSRAFLKTDWQPVGGTGEFPPEFTKRMEEDKLVLDLALSRLLPEFEWAKSPQGQVPDSEKLTHA
ncbi:MAG: hypothetical protein ACHQ1H_01475 [Nitrososphaerales archaeon]